MKRKISVIVLMIFSVSVFAVASGCGKKGPPLPPEEEKSITAPKPSGETTEPAAKPGGETKEEPKSQPAPEPGGGTAPSPY